jgi:hypothetical protein
MKLMVDTECRDCKYIDIPRRGIPAITEREGRKMHHKTEIIMGMPLEIWRHKSCEAQIAEGDDWATVYLIESSQMNQGHAQELLKLARRYYEQKGFRFGGTVALNPVMAHIYKKLDIFEYTDEEATP